MLIKRHAGVLGLSAFVQAYPYDVPEFMPQILMDLSNHVNDPQPIQVNYYCSNLESDYSIAFPSDNYYICLSLYKSVPLTFNMNMHSNTNVSLNQIE